MSVFLRYLLFLVAWIGLVDGLLKSPEEKEFDVISNPHQQQSSDVMCFSNLDGFLEPYHLLTVPLPTQPDTFQELTYAKVMSVPVPV